MKELEIGATALGCPLSAAQLTMFETYRRELLLWNRRTNLTSITDPAAVELLHFLDSLSVATALPVRPESTPALTLLDVGTGAGFPGLPLKIALPHHRLWLLESTGKKVTFLHHMVDILGLSDVTVLKGRAEDLAHSSELREGFDVTLARAVGHLAVLAELCLPFTKVNGLFVAMKKGSMEREIQEAAEAIEILGGRRTRILPVQLDALRDDRSLVAICKEEPSPKGYPRRPGMPAKRPLGARPGRLFCETCLTDVVAREDSKPPP